MSRTCKSTIRPMTADRSNGIFYGVDRWTVLLYVLIVLAGWVSITSASYEEGSAETGAEGAGTAAPADAEKGGEAK